MKPNNYFSKKNIMIFLALIIISAGCADVATCVTNAEYGFWNGLWHGIIAPFGFIGSLFNDKIAMYAVNNNGHWYDFGFALGTGQFLFYKFFRK
jgi:hypothetical protein